MTDPATPDQDGGVRDSVSEPPFDQPPVVRLEDESNAPEESILAQLHSVEILESAYYYEPEFNDEATQFHLDPFTAHDPDENLFHFALRLRLIETEQEEDDSVQIDDMKGVTELATVTVQLSFRVLNMDLIYEPETDELAMPGPVLSEILRTAYNVTQGVWVSEVDGTPYRQFHLPTPDVKNLLEYFFDYSAEATPVPGNAD
jgi:hypothetical protein